MTPDLIIRIIADAAVIPVVLIGATVLIVKVPKGQRYQAYCRVLMAGLTAYLLAKFIGTLYQPSTERPFELLGVDPGALYLDNPGFPSDHTLFAAAIVLAVWFETKMPKTTLLLVALVALISFGRVIALVHTPLDVIGGIVIAMLGGLWYLNKAGGQKRQVKNGKSTG